MIYRKPSGRLILVTLLVFFLFSSIPVLGESTANNTASSEPYAIDGGSSPLNLPHGIAYSAKTGALIIADTQNHRILSCNLKDGKLTTLAGITKGEDRFGSPGGGYADGDAAKAMFNYPRGVAVSENGTIVIADTGNHAIRQISGGIVSTIAGGKTAGYNDGKGTAASFLSPGAVTVDTAGNIFVSDTLNNVIRKIDTKSNVTTFAGKKDALDLLNEPAGLVFGKDGALYVTDGGNHQVKKITDEGKITVLAGTHSEKDAASGYYVGGYKDGPAESSAFNFPKGIAIKDDGTVFISDTSNHIIRAIKDNKVYTAAGAAGVAGEYLNSKYISLLEEPAAIVYADSTLFVADRYNNRILAIPDKNNRLSASGAAEAVAITYVALLNGSEITFPDVRPEAAGEKLMLPIRPLTDMLGSKISWDPKKRTVTIVKDNKSTTLSYQAGDFSLKQGRALVRSEILREKLNLKVKRLGEGDIILLETN